MIFSGPHGADSVCRDVACFSQFERTSEAMGEYLVRSGLLQQKVETNMQTGGAFPETFVSVARSQTASLSQSDKSLALTGAQVLSGIDAVARQMRRCIGPRGGGSSAGHLGGNGYGSEYE